MLMSLPNSRFDEAMFDIYRRAKAEAGYNASVYLQMLVDKGGLAAAKYLINKSQPSEGYTHLYERGRLDLTVEAMVVNGTEWHALFDKDELARAKKRLQAYGFGS
jgi:hypothetical protein